jgi:hypothetical protein
MLLEQLYYMYYNTRAKSAPKGVTIVFFTLHVIVIDVQGIRLSKANEIMHLGMVFHCVNDGLGNSVHQMKD